MVGNLKLGPDVVSYSRLPGRPSPHGGTCPGATPECLSICYAFRIDGIVRQVYEQNSQTALLPRPLPEGTKYVRIHVSGDFDTIQYIEEWISLAEQNPAVRFWAYSRSWRVPELLPALERLRALPNVQIFASMDSSDDEQPDDDLFHDNYWRRAWLSTDERSGFPALTGFDEFPNAKFERARTDDGVISLTCPEESGLQPDCQTCGYCLLGQKGDVTFIVH